MARPLYDKIKQYSDNCKARFCMPGHGGTSSCGDLYSSAVYDWTEVDGLDNLLESSGVIAQSENRLAEIYGYEGALMLTQGSTCGMYIALRAAKQRGGTVVAVGDMHKSFWSACRVLGLEILFYPDVKSAAKASIKADVCAVFVTSPDYFGRLTDLTQIRMFADALGALLVVDEAHSAHFPYTKLLPANANKYADISLISMHKTMPVYGGGALVCVNGKETFESCRMARAELHSSSPSYLIMASMDYAADLMLKCGEKEYEDIKRAVDNFAKTNCAGKLLINDDFSRLVIKIDGKDCYSVGEQLAKKGIFAEAVCGDLIVFIVTPYNKDMLSLLADALKQIDVCKLPKFDLPSESICLKRVDGALDGEIELVEPENCTGRISAGEIGVYPPGVPMIKRGDVLDDTCAEFIKKYRKRLFGLASGYIAVIK